VARTRASAAAGTGRPGDAFVKPSAKAAGRVVTRAARNALRTGEALGRDLLRPVSWVGARRRRPPPGSSPGILIADPLAPPPVVRMQAWGPDGIEEAEGFDPERLAAWRTRWPVVWLDVDGLGDVQLIERIGEMFGLHRLALEDVVNVGQRAKVERYPNHLFVVGQLTTLEGRVRIEQVAIFLGRGFVVTFQERPGDSLEPIRARARSGRGRIRVAGPGYLTYAITDAIVDHYFPILEAFGDRLDALEEEIIRKPTQATMQRIHEIRRNLMILRRNIWPMRETLSGLTRDPGEFFEDEDKLYLQDCYDHTIQVMDLLESYREVASGLMDIYLSSLSHRMNEVMKVLTVFSAIFIPLGFIAGVYGMNFDPSRSPLNMPELAWRYGYPFALALMATVALGLLTFFWRKGWIGGGAALGESRDEPEAPPAPGPPSAAGRDPGPPAPGR